MSTSAIGSSNPYRYLQYSQLSGTDSSDSTSSTDTSGAPSDPLLALFKSATGGSSTGDPLLDSIGDDSSQGPTSPFNPDTMSGAIFGPERQSDRHRPATGSSALQSLMSKFDANGDGSDSQSEYEQAIGPAADKTKLDLLFNALDANGDGSISQSELSSGVQKAHHGGGHHHHHAGGAGGAGQSQASDPLSQLMSGTTTPGRWQHQSVHHQRGRLDVDEADLCRRHHDHDEHAGGSDLDRWLIVKRGQWFVRLFVEQHHGVEPAGDARKDDQRASADVRAAVGPRRDDLTRHLAGQRTLARSVPTMIVPVKPPSAAAFRKLSAVSGPLGFV